MVTLLRWFRIGIQQDSSPTERSSWIKLCVHNGTYGPISPARHLLAKKEYRREEKERRIKTFEITILH